MSLLRIGKSIVEKWFYILYEKGLESQSASWQIPEHIGIILDGNRRYARKRGFDNLIKGHYDGADKLEEVLSWCRDFGVKVVSIWIFSLDNFKREDSEIADIFSLIEAKMHEMSNSAKLHENRVQIRSMGKIEVLPETLQTAIRKAEEVTKDYNGFILNIAVAYGGREEIIEAFRSHLLAESNNGKNPSEIAEKLTEEDIQAHLYTSDLPDPDLIIRTSGEIRLGGFLLWQSVYSEFYFCDTYWPSFRKIDFLRSIREYNRRQRRFGK